MRACLLLLLLAPAAKPDLVDILDGWIKSYRNGRVDLRSFEDVSKRSRLLRAKLLPPVHGPVTAMRELQLMLDAAAADGTAASALRVLRIAGSGLDQFDYRLGHAPAQVRTVAERALHRYREPAALQLVLEVARGTHPAAADPDTGAAAQAAALRALGVFGRPGFRQELERALRRSHPQFRLAAAYGLQRLNDAATAPALVEALEKESHEAALVVLADALRDVFQMHQDKIETRVLLRGTRAVVAALGRTAWRGDLALVEYLDKFRSVEAIPPLIALLEHYHAHPEWIASGKISGVLRARAHEVLVGLTGAPFPAEQPAQWRAFWDREKDRFALAKQKPVLAAADEHTVASGFFGILPVGSRVVFVIDVSGSMRERYAVTSKTGRVQTVTKLDAAKREMIQAIFGLPPESAFNIVLFSATVQPWRAEMQPASETNKAAAARYIRKQQPHTSTNLWGGLERALMLKSLVYGERYPSHVDEVFLLSDGAPTAGTLVQPQLILTTINDTNRFSGVRLNTVFLGTGSDFVLQPAGMGPPLPYAGWMSPEELMEKMARDNGGRFVRPR